VCVLTKVYDELTACNGFLLQKLRIAQRIKKFADFYGTPISIAWSQEPATDKVYDL
jgi:hypothetical protein